MYISAVVDAKGHEAPPGCCWGDVCDAPGRRSGQVVLSPVWDSHQLRIRPTRPKRQRDFSAFLQVVSLSCLGVQTRASFLRRVDRVRLEGWLKRNYRELSSERDTSVFQAALSCRTLSTGAKAMRRPILPKHRKSHGFHHLVILCIITVT